MTVGIGLLILLGANQKGGTEPSHAQSEWYNTITHGSESGNPTTAGFVATVKPCTKNFADTQQVAPHCFRASTLRLSVCAFCLGEFSVATSPASSLHAKNAK